MAFNFKQNRFFPALELAHDIPERFRRRVGSAATGGAMLGAVGTLIALAAPSLELPPIPPQPFAGIFMFCCAIRLSVLMLDAFARSLTAEPDGKTGGRNAAERLSYEAAELWYAGAVAAGAKTVCEFSAAAAGAGIGRAVFARLGVAADEIRTRCGAGDKNAPQIASLAEDVERAAEQRGDLSLADVLTALFRRDAALKAMLVERGVLEADVAGAADWVARMRREEDAGRRWWRKENLARRAGVAKNWAYGSTYYLGKFGRELTGEEIPAQIELIGHDREIDLLETALLRASNANVLIVGEPGTGKHTALIGLTRMIRDGRIFPELEHKRVFLIAGPTLVASGKTKGETEALLIKILNEAAYAGNIILAIEDFPETVESFSALGITATQLFAPYLASPAIHVIALATAAGYRKTLEEDKALMKYFEKIEFAEPDMPHLIRILEDIAPVVETTHRGRAVFTYQAVRQVAEGGMRYLVQGALPERAVTLLEETALAAADSGNAIIGADFVAALIKQKTNIPLGKIDAAEQEKLTHLESLLQKRVVGQREAIGAIADTIRRARVGIRESKRPIGSFLFMGPTGVGKTETAKALADVYFGSEEKMIRFDMTEYQTEEGLERLIGSFKTGEPGALAHRMRSSPYAVVLLDELEKSDAKVKDLFIQILDEGFFTDAFGSRINMRNAIIVATSNAGSERILELIEQKTAAAEITRVITDYILKNNIFRPEFLNRFDSVVVFTPLGEAELREIARLMLRKLAERLAEKNITLGVTDELVEAAIRGGYNPAFGARPMRRFIQDTIEQHIAEKMIAGNLAPGSEVRFSAQEIASLLERPRGAA